MRFLLRALFATAVILALIVTAAMIWPREEAPESLPTESVKNEIVAYAPDPANATYFIEGNEFTLVNGAFDGLVEGGGAQSVSMFGGPALGDIDGDYDDDAVVLLIYESGGSGVFFYAAAAINQGTGYEGTNAIFIGDRIAPQTTSIMNRLIAVNFAERGEGEAMTAEPTRGTTAYLTLERGTLVRKAEDLPQGSQVLQGYLVWGAEIRTFRACGESQPDHWIMGDSPALAAIKETHERLAAGMPYLPLFVSIAGTITPPPVDGFGADFTNGVRVSELIFADPLASCKSDTIVVTSPRAGIAVTSPLTVSGYVRGPWAFEGDFPVTLVDWDGRIIAEGYVSTLDDWMTEGFVPFLGTLEFSSPATEAEYSQRGALILQKDNASGIPEMEDALEVPIRFR